MLLDPGVRVVDELYVCEGEVSDLAVELALPLAVDAHLGDLDDVADVEPERGLVVGVRHARLLHARVRGQLALERENEGADLENKSTYFAWLFFWFCQQNETPVRSNATVVLIHDVLLNSDSCVCIVD